MSKAASRAVEVGLDPKVKRWVAAFRKVFETQPDNVWVYVANGTVHIMARDTDGKRFTRPGHGSDQDAIVETIGSGEWDGGDW